MERKKSGHVITNRLSVSPNVRPASSASGSTTDVMSKTLPSSFTHRRSRPLKDDSNSTSTPKRSQTPSRYSQRPSSAASNHSMSSSFSHTPTQSRYQVNNFKKHGFYTKIYLEKIYFSIQTMPKKTSSRAFMTTLK